jgi:hypothetical protein
MPRANRTFSHVCEWFHLRQPRALKDVLRGGGEWPKPPTRPTSRAGGLRRRTNTILVVDDCEGVARELVRAPRAPNRRGSDAEEWDLTRELGEGRYDKWCHCRKWHHLRTAQLPVFRTMGRRASGEEAGQTSHTKPVKQFRRGARPQGLQGSAHLPWGLKRPGQTPCRIGTSRWEGPRTSPTDSLRRGRVAPRRC